MSLLWGTLGPARYEPGPSTEVAPVRGDYEEHASEGECNACDDRSRNGHLEGRDLSRDEPDSGEQDQQEADLGQGDARVMAHRKHKNDGSYFGCSVLRVTELPGLSPTCRRCRPPCDLSHPQGSFNTSSRWLIKGASLITSAVINDWGRRAVPATQRIIPSSNARPTTLKATGSSGVEEQLCR